MRILRSSCGTGDHALHRTRNAASCPHRAVVLHALFQQLRPTARCRAEAVQLACMQLRSVHAYHVELALGALTM